MKDFFTNTRNQIIAVATLLICGLGFWLTGGEDEVITTTESATTEIATESEETLQSESDKEVTETLK